MRSNEEDLTPQIASWGRRRRSNPTINFDSMQLSIPSLILVACAVSACKSDPPPVTMRDAQGNFVTTADYESMDRAEFIRSIEAGLADFDKQLGDLRTRANELGGDSLKEFAEHEGDLRDERTTVVNQLTIARNALDDKWPEERAETVDAYMDLREDLADAQKEVLDR
jgi:hypothetical protein